MNNSKDHYDQLLAEVYDWMAGDDLNISVSGQKQLLGKLLPIGLGKAKAVDLGCRSGFQSFALSEIGFGEVVAIDTSAALLATLNQHKLARSDDRVFAHEASISYLGKIVGAGTADLVVCMGDTLTHLTSEADVSDLFEACKLALAEGGVLVLTFRDYTKPLIGTERFIPVRSTADRIMTCFLEYQPQNVIVHDIVHTRVGDQWQQSISAYPKLRLLPDQLEANLTSIGFDVLPNAGAGRMVSVVARKRTAP
jgi:SAM-dependent methyltransferase